MTIAAALTIGGFPVVIADMLITNRDGDSPPGVTLPAVGSAEPFRSQAGTIHGLRQKVAVITENLAIAGAGTVLNLTNTVGALRKWAKDQTPTAQGFEEFCKSRGAMLGNSALVGWLLDPSDGMVHSINWNVSEFEDAHFGTVLAAGSGTRSLQRLLAADMVHARGAAIPKTSNDAVAIALAFCGSMLREEHATGSTLRDSQYGGCYEIAIYDGFRFLKAEPLNWVVWVVDVIDKTMHVRPPYLIVKQTYVDDVAVLQSVRWPGIEIGRWVVDTFSVPPLYRPNLGNVTTPSFQAGALYGMTVHSILVDVNGERNILSLVEGGKCAVSIASGGERGLEISYNGDFLQRVQEAVWRHYFEPSRARKPDA